MVCLCHIKARKENLHPVGKVLLIVNHQYKNISDCLKYILYIFMYDYLTFPDPMENQREKNHRTPCLPNY